MQPLSSCERKGLLAERNDLGLKRIGKRDSVKTATMKQKGCCRQKVKLTIEKAKRTRCRFGLTMDAWKSKGSMKKSYASVMAHWISPEWKQVEVCLGMPELVGMKKSPDLKRTALKAMNDMGIEIADVIAFTTDHDRTQRKAVRGLSNVMICCCCHGIQLIPRHMLPLVLTKKQEIEEEETATKEEDAEDETPPVPPLLVEEADEEDGEDEDDSDEKSEGDEDEESEEDAYDYDYTEEQLKYCDWICGEESYSESDVAHKAERFALRALLQPVFDKCRKLVKWFIHHHDIYNSFSMVCKPEEWKRFQRETATRWSSQLSMICSVLHNNAKLVDVPLAIKKTYPSKLVERIPPHLTREECKLVQSVAGVLTPFRRATRLMESSTTTSLAGSFLPTYMGLTKHLEADTTPKPAEGGVGSEAGTEGGANQDLPKDQLHQTAQRMKAWCVLDLKRQQTKYIGDSSEVLSAAALLDPRHKSLTKTEFQDPPPSSRSSWYQGWDLLPKWVNVGSMKRKQQH